MSQPVQRAAPVKRKRRWAGPGVLLVVWAALSLLQWRTFNLDTADSVGEALGAFALVNLNILLLLLLLFLTLRNLAKLMLERKRGILGSKLKTRMVLAFLATTVIPTFMLFLISAGFLARSIDGWFSTRVGSALEDAMGVARAYYAAEERATVEAGTIIAERFAQEGAPDDLEELKAALEQMLRRHRLDLLHVTLEQGQVMQVSSEGYQGLGVDINAAEVREAFEGTQSTAHMSGEATGDVIRAVVPLTEGEPPQILGVVVADRRIPISSVDKLAQITSGFEEYRQIEHLRAAVKASYILPLLLAALLIMFAATWFGFHLARTITEPIGALADATQRVSGGDLDFQVEVLAQDEIGTLIEYFNHMTRDLMQSREKVESARTSLQESNAELESWRIYMEAVMDRVSAGVIGTDTEGRITTINPAAREMLGVNDDVVGMSYVQAFPPEVRSVVDALTGGKALKRGDTLRRQVILPGDGMRRTVMVHMTTLRDDAGAVSGTVAVLNDLTDLVKAERAQAWREVARRVAHEIKNPLTPVQLSAQRLRRRYAELLETADGEVLDEATRTIVTQVDGLKYLVNEFSRFAKMPESRPHPAQLNQIVEEAVGLYRPAHSSIHFDVRLEDDSPIASLDTEQVKRALVNLLENSSNALADTEDGMIEVITEHDPLRQAVRLVVADNGPGLSSAARERLFEPYFSTKKGGTGLGLAIVKSIVADHRGYVRALDNKPHGTRFIIEFPLSGA